MASKKKSTKKKPTIAPNLDASMEAPPEAATRTKAGPTLHDAAEGYLAAIEKDDAGPGTLSSYRMELKLAMRELGEATPVGELTPERIQEYFDCDAVMRTKHGKPKAKPTFDKSRRVLRLALQWAQDSGLIEVAPLPAKPIKVVPIAVG